MADTRDQTTIEDIIKQAGPKAEASPKPESIPQSHSNIPASVRQEAIDKASTCVSDELGAKISAALNGAGLFPSRESVNREKAFCVGHTIDEVLRENGVTHTSNRDIQSIVNGAWQKGNAERSR